MSDFARRRIAKRKASQAAPIRQSIPTVTARTMLAARQAGSDAVRYNDGLAGTKALKVVRPHGWTNPLSEHFEDSTTTVYGRDTARNPRDHQAEMAAKLDLMASFLRQMRIVK